MTMTVSDISLRTAGYVAGKLLMRADPALIMQPFLQTHEIPQNASSTIKFRRYAALAAAIADLTEGVTPPSSTITHSDYEANLSQIGAWVGISDRVADTHEDPIIKEYTSILAKQAALSVETRLFNVMKAGTNVYFANGTARTDVNTPLTKALQQKITRGFKRQNASTITERLSSSAKMETVSVKPSFIAFIHPDLEPTVQAIPGSIGDVRYLTSTVFTSWADGGGLKAGSGTTMISTTGTSADVYPIIYIAAECAAVTPLKGKTALDPFVVNPGTSREGDQLGQRGWIGWKTYFAAVILNQLWMCRAEVAAAEL